MCGASPSSSFFPLLHLLFLVHVLPEQWRWQWLRSTSPFAIAARCSPTVLARKWWLPPTLLGGNAPCSPSHPRYKVGGPKGGRCGLSQGHPIPRPLSQGLAWPAHDHVRPGSRNLTSQWACPHRPPLPALPGPGICLLSSQFCENVYLCLLSTSPSGPWLPLF